MAKMYFKILTFHYLKDQNIIELKFQGMLEGRHKVTHPFYTDMEQLEFQILLIDIYYINRNSTLICFPMQIQILMMIWLL